MPGERKDALAEIEEALRDAMALDLLGYLTIQHVTALEHALSLLPRLREVVTLAAKVSHFREREGESDIFKWAQHMDDLRTALAALEGEPPPPAARG